MWELFDRLDTVLRKTLVRRGATRKVDANILNGVGVIIESHFVTFGAPILTMVHQTSRPVGTFTDEVTSEFLTREMQLSRGCI